MYKTNRVNHDFQLVHFLAGACHTPDAAYAQMCDQEDDRQMALNTAKAAEKRVQAALIRVKRKLQSHDEADILEAEADLMEHENGLELSQRNVAAAQAELATIRKIKDGLEPLRKFKHLPLVEAHQAAQQEEWRLHLLFTAQNMMLSQGSIAHDYIGTMRMHPEFESKMVPLLDTWRAEIIRIGVNPDGEMAHLSFIKAPAFSVPRMIEAQSATPLLQYSAE